MSDPEKFSAQRITQIKFWTPNLFTFKTTRPASLTFTPGQFVRLGLHKEDGSEVWRAYSFVSAPDEENLEFYSIVAPDGEFSPRLAKMRTGDELLVAHTAFGFLTLDRFEDGRDLWLLATGTGLAPYISMLRTPEPWHRFERIFLVHSVRLAADLTYRDEIEDLARRNGPQTHTAELRYVAMVTREKAPDTLGGRITQLIENGALEQAACATLSPQHSRIMVCGNPEMVRDTRKLLTGMGYTVSRSATPGPLALENQW
ncbi:MAG: ferredoxin--NADP reductase [Burkholderiales bacterium]|nr:ferredoxin--NADP reductase [Burkholderiales bacterium]MDE2610949.1 ferredoxin--NADP reductase [Burkholderiales bacterium]